MKWYKDCNEYALSETEDSPPHARVRPLSDRWAFEVYLFKGHRVMGVSESVSKAKAWVKVYLSVEQAIKAKANVKST